MHKVELLNTDDAANFLGISRGTLEHWRTETPPKGPPYIRLGYQVRYRAADLVQWIERNVVLFPNGEDDGQGHSQPSR